MLLNLIKESLEKPYSDFVSSVIIVTVTWEVTLSFVINNNTVFVSYCLNLSILNSAERVNNVRETCNTCCKCSSYICINKCHFSSFIIVFIMHKLNEVKDINIKACEPIHHSVISFDYFVIIEVF